MEKQKYVLGFTVICKDGSRIRETATTYEEDGLVNAENNVAWRYVVKDNPKAKYAGGIIRFDSGREIDGSKRSNKKPLYLLLKEDLLANGIVISIERAKKLRAQFHITNKNYSDVVNKVINFVKEKENMGNIEKATETEVKVESANVEVNKGEKEMPLRKMLEEVRLGKEVHIVYRNVSIDIKPHEEEYVPIDNVDGVMLYTYDVSLNDAVIDPIYVYDCDCDDIVSELADKILVKGNEIFQAAKENKTWENYKEEEKEMEVKTMYAGVDLTDKKAVRKISNQVLSMIIDKKTNEEKHLFSKVFNILYDSGAYMDVCEEEDKIMVLFGDSGVNITTKSAIDFSREVYIEVQDPEWVDAKNAAAIRTRLADLFKPTPAKQETTDTFNVKPVENKVVPVNIKQDDSTIQKEGKQVEEKLRNNPYYQMATGSNEWKEQDISIQIKTKVGASEIKRRLAWKHGQDGFVSGTIKSLNEITGTWFWNTKKSYHPAIKQYGKILQYTKERVVKDTSEILYELKAAGIQYAVEKGKIGPRTGKLIEVDTSSVLAFSRSLYSGCGDVFSAEEADVIRGILRKLFLSNAQKNVNALILAMHKALKENGIYCRIIAESAGINAKNPAAGTKVCTMTVAHKRIVAGPVGNKPTESDFWK